METRANYVLIGAFALAGFLGLLGFVLWFAQVELDRQFAYYNVRFDSVAGLSRASEVRFAGLPVGQVVDVRLSPEGDGTVLTRLEVAANTPVRADSIATIESQGVTGVAFVGISSGTPDAPRLDATAGIPEITAGRSVLQVLSEDAPDIVAEALTVLQSISGILSVENQQNVQTILDNLTRSSADLSQTLDDFTVVSQTIASAATDIAFFTEQIEPVVAALQTTLGNVDTTLAGFAPVADRLLVTLDEGDATLASGRAALDAARGFVSGDLPALVAELTQTTTLLRAEIASLAEGTRGMITEFSGAGRAAGARLAEAEALLTASEAAIADLVVTLDSVTRAATSFDELVTTEGYALVDETRAMVANADTAMTAIAGLAETDLPEIMADIRTATDTANRVIAQLGADLTGASGRIEGLSRDASAALNQITETFANANGTLGAINGALVTGTRTLEAAERAFFGADRVINEDLGAITADLRAVMTRLDGAIAQVADDIPAITADLRAAAETANAAFATLGGIVAESGAPLREFTTTGLPQYSQLARETRTLIGNLDQLVRQIERDPARFFLDRQTPEFRR